MYANNTKAQFFYPKLFNYKYFSDVISRTGHVMFVLLYTVALKKQHVDYCLQHHWPVSSRPSLVCLL